MIDLKLTQVQKVAIRLRIIAVFAGRAKEILDSRDNHTKALIMAEKIEIIKLRQSAIRDLDAQLVQLQHMRDEVLKVIV
jgi:hypothetical protein